MTSKIPMHIAVLFLLCTLVFVSATANVFAHNDDHDAPSSETAKLAHLQQIINLLTQVVDLLAQKAALHGIIVAHEHKDEDADTVAHELAIWVEIHSNNVIHAHIQLPQAAQESFVIEGVTYTDEEQIIQAIADKTGLSLHKIEEVIVFPSGEVDAHGDSVDNHDEDTQEDVRGIHIMADGSIMWGNGTAVEGATTTEDGKVKLSDGTIIIPAFDLR